MFAEAFPAVRGKVFTWANYGPLTLPELLGLGHCPVIGGFLVVVLLLFLLFEWAKL